MDVKNALIRSNESTCEYLQQNLMNDYIILYQTILTPTVECITL